jgi:Fe-S oxidoreductase/FAD/FMN-containing dehydrogenase
MFSASVGGTIAYNAVPHGITEYGTTAEHVITLQVVLPDGTVIHTGSAANKAAGRLPIERGANGPDLAGLFIGSCGTLGVITEATMRIRRIPETEKFLFYAFDRLERAVDAVSAMQRAGSATFIIGLFGGPKPSGIAGNYFLHMIIRDSRTRSAEREHACQVICETFDGRPQDADCTRRYWTEHMYSWLRNTGPGTYYGSRPYYCPEVAGFVPTQALKEIIPAVNQYITDTKADWDKHGILVKGFDVYFSRNAGFLWIDTLYNESDPQAHRYGLKVRADISELLFSRWMSPGGIVAGIAPYIMEKLGPTFVLMQTLKDSLDPQHILNPGVLMLGGRPASGRIPAQKEDGHTALQKVGLLTYQCLRCAFCFDLSWLGPYHLCPSYLSGSYETYNARGRIALARALLEGELDYSQEVADRIFSCTMCGSCGDHCFKYIDIARIYQAMREDMAKRGLTPPGLKSAAEAVLAERNPYGQPAAERFRWLHDKSTLDRKAPVALFVGCTPSYVRRSSAQEAVELLQKLGIEFTIASDEDCCAHPLLSAGERGEAEAAMRHNLEVYQSLGVEKLVFACPGCYETFRNELPEVLGQPLPFEARHLVELVAEELAAGRVALDGMPPGTTITYHDPCTLGRQLGIYEAPRAILKAIPGTHFQELPRHGRDSFCCGAGAFVRYDYPQLTEAAGQDRWREAVASGAKVLATACPACLSQFQMLRSQTGDPLEVVDLVAVVRQLVRVREVAV